jgi:hypothetical protein
VRRLPISAVLNDVRPGLVRRRRSDGTVECLMASVADEAEALAGCSRRRVADCSHRGAQLGPHLHEQLSEPVLPAAG